MLGSAPWELKEHTLLAGYNQHQLSNGHSRKIITGTRANITNTAGHTKI